MSQQDYIDLTFSFSRKDSHKQHILTYPGLVIIRVSTNSKSKTLIHSHFVTSTALCYHTHKKDIKDNTNKPAVTEEWLSHSQGVKLLVQLVVSKKVAKHTNE